MTDTPATEQGRLPFDVIRDVIFPLDAADSSPTLTLVAGEAGSGRSSAAARVASEQGERSAVVSADDAAMVDLRAVEAMRWQPLTAGTALSGRAADLLQQSIAYARSARQSLVLEGSFGAPETALAVVESFAEEGFETRVVIVASRRAESLLAVASQYLWQRQSRLPARFTSSDIHRRGWESTRALADAVAAPSAVDRVTAIGRDGALLFDEVRTNKERPSSGVATAVAAVDNTVWTPRAAAEWFSDLRRATDYARAARELAPPVAQLLLELHRVGLNEILPAMPFPKGSTVVADQERRLAEEAVDLRRYASAARRVDQPVPQPSSAPAIDPSRPTGPSL